MADSKTVVQALHEVDPGFRALADTVFGKALDVDEVWAAIYTPQGISKMMPTPADVHVPGGGILVPTRKKRKRVEKGIVLDELVDDGEVIKEDQIGITWAGEFSKMDTDKRQAFGFASVVQLGGQPVLDKQGDFITPDEIEKAAYDYVKKSRVGGSQHRRDGDKAFHAADMIESMVFTPEKIEKMGLPDTFPVSWWVGYEYHDEDTWQDIKKGRKTGFSIHGRGRRVPVDA